MLYAVITWAPTAVNCPRRDRRTPSLDPVPRRAPASWEPIFCGPDGLQAAGPKLALPLDKSPGAIALYVSLIVIIYRGLISMKYIKGVDLNLLKALDALLDERNVTRAASRLSYNFV